MAVRVGQHQMVAGHMKVDLVEVVTPGGSIPSRWTVAASIAADCGRPTWRWYQAPAVPRAGRPDRAGIDETGMVARACARGSPDLPRGGAVSDDDAHEAAKEVESEAACGAAYEIACEVACEADRGTARGSAHARRSTRSAKRGAPGIGRSAPGNTRVRSGTRRFYGNPTTPRSAREHRFLPSVRAASSGCATPRAAGAAPAATASSPSSPRSRSPASRWASALIIVLPRHERLPEGGRATGCSACSRTSRSSRAGKAPRRLGARSPPMRGASTRMIGAAPYVAGPGACSRARTAARVRWCAASTPTAEPQVTDLADRMRERAPRQPRPGIPGSAIGRARCPAGDAGRAATGSR
jgi:hypothetical protein